MPNIQKILQKSHAIVVEDETSKRTCGAKRRVAETARSGDEMKVEN